MPTKGKEFSVSWPKLKKLKNRSQLNAALKTWQKTTKKPSPPKKNPAFAIKASSVTKTSLSKVVSQIRPVPFKQRGKKKQFNPQAFLSDLYSSFASHDYLEMQKQYLKRKAAARGQKKILEVENQWKQHQKAAQMAFAAGGLNVSTANLSKFNKVLTAKGKQNNLNYTTLKEVARSRRLTTARKPALTGNFKPRGSFNPITPLLFEPLDIATVIPGICEAPIAQGTYTKHFTRSFSLEVSFTGWCPTWTNPFRTCTWRIPIAGASFSMGLEVGYEVTCCGATAWGTGWVQACVSALGFSACAGCTGTVLGVVGVGAISSSNGLCTYGLGVSAELRCKVGSLTVFYAYVPFGWTIQGPCPPIGICGANA